MLTPLRIPERHWRSRWLVFPSTWKVLHRVASVEWDKFDMKWVQGTGMTVCGRKGRLRMPGIMSRMDLPRCKFCCKATGVPEGNGAPFNEGINEKPKPEAL